MAANGPMPIRRTNGRLPLVVSGVQNLVLTPKMTILGMSDEKSQIWGLPEKAGFIFYFITFLALAPWATKRDCLFFKIIQYNRLL